MRFQKRVKILPGITLNFSKSGVSTSIGLRGARYTFGNGKSQTTIGIPGTGLSHTTVHKNDASVMAAVEAMPSPQSLKSNIDMIICPECHKKTLIDLPKCIRCNADISSVSTHINTHAASVQSVQTTLQRTVKTISPILKFISGIMFFITIGFFLGLLGAIFSGLKKRGRNQPD